MPLTIPVSLTILLFATAAILSIEARGPQTIGEFKGRIHGVKSGNVIILDTKTIQIKNFHYDGSAPDVFFWVGQGNRPNKNGRQIQDELGSSDKLKGYNGKDIELFLPRGVTVKDIDYISVWCRKYATNFGHVTIPKNLNVPEYSDN